MAGIYLHIPFCKQACHYCNFHFSTSLNKKGELVKAIQKELELQKDFLGGEVINSIYFGGGTPSLLTKVELEALLSTVTEHFAISESPEITLEANPDDLGPAYLKMLAESSVNRLSIGVQSFFDDDLTYMNRAHSADESLACIQAAKEAGFDSISIDLIYGLPTSNNDQWKENVNRFLSLGLNHLSAYCLTVEPDTALHHFIAQGKTKPVDEVAASHQFLLLMDEMERHGYRHYEISNFSLPEKEAVHNSNYWKQVPYLGVGPAAHSYNGKSRQWNIAHNQKYMAAIRDGQVPYEVELLSKEDRHNEYIMTSLRTIWGCDLNKIDQQFRVEFEEGMKSFIANGDAIKTEGMYYLTKSGKLKADGIASKLFVTNDS